MLEQLTSPETTTTESPASTGRRSSFSINLMHLAFALLLAIATFASAEETRRLKSGAPPTYPELARKLSIRGIARVLATVAPDGSVVEVKEKGGNPVLVDALVRAVKKWKYEPADKTTTIEVQFAFTSE